MKKWILPVLILLAVAGCLWLAAYPYWPNVIPDKTAAPGLGAWMSGIGGVALQAIVIFLLYRTYRSQQAELQKAAEIMEAQSDSMRRQRVDSTFFELLGRYDAAVDSVYHSPDFTMKVDGRKAFEFLVGTIMAELDKADSDLTDWIAVRRVVMERRREYSDWIRSINTICSFLKRDGGDDIGYYITIFRGYLSEFEMQFLLIELASREDGSFTASFLSKYGIFRYLPVSADRRKDWWGKMREQLVLHQKQRPIS